MSELSRPAPLERACDAIGNGIEALRNGDASCPAQLDRSDLLVLLCAATSACANKHRVLELAAKQMREIAEVRARADGRALAFDDAGFHAMMTGIANRLAAYRLELPGGW